MELTLYSNCRLTKGYNEVFQADYLEGYLATLTSVTYTIEKVYLTNNGSLPLDMMEDGNYQYNYFKLYDTDNDITRYFFIDNLTIVNGTCVIDYSEDIWSSYSSMISIVRGELSNLRYGPSNFLYRLPSEYMTTKPLKIHKIQNSSSVNLVVTCSYSMLTEGGEVINRIYKTFLVGSTDSSVDNFTISDALEYLKGLHVAGGDPDFNYAFDDEGHTISFNEFEIVNSYLVPSSFGVGNYVYRYGSYIDVYLFDDLAVTTIYLHEMTPVENDDVVLLSTSITSDYKHYMIGTLDHLIPIENYGKGYTIKLNLFVNDIYFGIFMNVSGNYVDITNSFQVDLPISVQSADVTQQQAIAKQLKNQQLSNESQNIQNNALLNAIKGTTGVVGNFGSIATGNAVGGGLGAINSFINLGQGMVNAQYQLSQNDLERWHANYPMYKTSSSVSVKDNKLASIYYGLIYVDVDPDSESSSYINNLIDTIGYKVTGITTTNSLITTPQDNNDYNIIRFSNLWLTGNLPHNTLEELKAILMKGFKIYFTSDV